VMEVVPTINVCFAVAIVINSLTYHIMCAILVGGGKYEIYFSYVIW
jgi:hypothetical protein